MRCYGSGGEEPLRLILNREGKGLNARDRYDHTIPCTEADTGIPGVAVDRRQTDTTHDTLREWDCIQRRTIQFAQTARRTTGTPEGLEVSQR